MKLKYVFTLMVFFALNLAGASEPFKLIHTADLDTMLSQDNKPTVVDANNNETREKYGVIPGAIMLDYAKKGDLSGIPKDPKTQLVFYCANTKCTASHAAAKSAVKAGYKNVSVFADGIMGWKKAGKPTEDFKKSGG